MRREQTRDGQFRHVQGAVEVLQGVVARVRVVVRVRVVDREWCGCQGVVLLPGLDC